MSTPPKTTKLELRTALGRVYRDVLTTPPRDCTPDEIPIISLSALSGDLEARKGLAREIRSAAVNTGFFYVGDHGIGEGIIGRARGQALKFFTQSEEDKMKVSQKLSRGFNGWKGAGQTNISPGETPDMKESLMWQYSPLYDPIPKPLSEVPSEVKPYLRAEEFVWEGTSHIPNFKEDILTYWSSCLTLARQLVQVFALSLDLPEDYFDGRVTYPGADGVLNYYPTTTPAQQSLKTVGLGSHTDLQLFTLLWQDMTGGLQVLNRDGQWIKATPVEGTIVVNIGDFMMRLCNDVYKSTVHRVYNTSTVERVSMPFFFGLNFNCVEGVIPTCCSEENPAKYEPISCGDWVHLRFSQEQEEFKKNSALEAHAPSGKIIAA